MRQPETHRDTPEPADDTDLPDELLNARVRFWMCINRDHKSVTWEGDVATCPDCGITSDMTRAYAQRVRARCREEIEREVSADLDKFAGALSTQLRLHANQRGHENLAHRVCQTCRTFRELRDHPAIQAANARVIGAVVDALHTGNYVACEPPEDRIARGEL